MLIGSHVAAASSAETILSFWRDTYLPVDPSLVGVSGIKLPPLPSSLRKTPAGVSFWLLKIPSRHRAWLPFHIGSPGKASGTFVDVFEQNPLPVLIWFPSLFPPASRSEVASLSLPGPSSYCPRLLQTQV